jgi:hypothetical protein
MDEAVSITCIPNGPLRVTGNFVVKDSQGKDFDVAGRTTISCVDADSRRTSHSATEAMHEPDFNPSSKLASFPRRHPNPKETGEFVIVQCSIVICHLWNGTEAFFQK